MKPHDPIVFLRHIQDACVQIQLYINDVEPGDFYRNNLIQDGVIRQLEVIGEAARNIPKAFRAQHPHVAWQEIAGMRDKLIHDYFGVDLDIVWVTARKDIPQLRNQIHTMLSP